MMIEKRDPKKMFGGVACSAKLAKSPLSKDINYIHAGLHYISMRVSNNPELQGRELLLTRYKDSNDTLHAPNEQVWYTWPGAEVGCYLFSGTLLCGYRCYRGHQCDTHII